MNWHRIIESFAGIMGPTEPKPLWTQDRQGSTKVEACGCRYETTIEHVYKLGQHGWDHVTSTWVPCEAHKPGTVKTSGAIDEWAMD